MCPEASDASARTQVPARTLAMRREVDILNALRTNPRHKNIAAATQKLTIATLASAKGAGTVEPGTRDPPNVPSSPSNDNDAPSTTPLKNSIAISPTVQVLMKPS